MMNTIVRKANENDLQAILNLVRELALYERAPEEVIVTEATFNIHWKNNRFEALVALENNRMCGCAIYYLAYSTWKGVILYLDDLIVTEEYRRKGIGKQLFDELIRVSVQLKVTQMRWHVLNWNKPAIRFYEKYNAELDQEWVTGKLSAEQLASLAKSGDI